EVVGEAEAARVRHGVGERAGQHVVVGGGRGARAALLTRLVVTGARVHVLRHRLRELLEELALEAQRGAVRRLGVLARGADVGRDRHRGAGHRGEPADIAHEDFTWLAIWSIWSCIWIARLA